MPGGMERINEWMKNTGETLFGDWLIRKKYRKAEQMAKGFTGKTEYISDETRFVVENIKRMEALEIRARRDLKKRDNYERKTSRRMTEWAVSLSDGAKALLDSNAIEESLREMDERLLLSCQEIWHAPMVLTIALTDAFLSLATDALIFQQEWENAEKWINASADEPVSSVHPAFFEHAVRLSVINEDAHKRETLVKRLALLGRSEDDILRIARDMHSDMLVRLQNAVKSMWALNDMNWKRVFTRVSCLENVLMQDPSGVYQQMDDESKDAVRQECAYLSRISFLPERLIASKAIEIANEDEAEGAVWALYTHAGRARLMESLNVRCGNKTRMFPDAGGKKLILTYIALSTVITCIAWKTMGFIGAVLAFPIVWLMAGEITRRLFSRFTRGGKLLRLKMDDISEDAAALVVIPALLSNTDSVEKACMQLETFGVNETSSNVDFLLLGDFKDADEEETNEDKEIIEKASGEIRNINHRCVREKYFYLHRKRRWNSKDEVWMGYERKRGALNELNRLLLSGENTFDAYGENARVLVNRYKYVITMDMDTEMIPGTIRKLIGTIHHPLNRPSGENGYAVIQPRMENGEGMLRNRFMRITSGVSGMDSYSSRAFDAYQDACGEGLFSGKGIYDIKAFTQRQEGAFQENRILSHDMIEGIFTKAGYAGDISVFEGFPKSPESYLKRFERWTRGDWQLIGFLFDFKRLRALDRFKIFDNLIRSLSHASSIALIILSAWTGKAAALLWGLLPVIAPAVLSGFRNVSPSFVTLLMLPSLACRSLAGIGRALYRTLVSQKHMLSWVTANDADGENKKENLEGAVCAILLIPSVMYLPVLPMMLLLAGCFVFGKGILNGFANENGEEEISGKTISMLMEWARDTWQYFEKYVPHSGNGLPPDNVQLDPPIGEARRTSPTNIGMYMVSVIGAKELGLIDECEMNARLTKTIHTIAALEKWNGLLFNWYDTASLKPMKPRYISSVDCGNLLASIITVRNISRDVNDKLRMLSEKLIAEMDICALYDRDKELFRIGYDAERDEMSASYYDLLSSEARILSFAAMAEKGIPLSHWQKLSRPSVWIRGRNTLLSWSGTMFEYMMPFLFMPSSDRSLLGQSAKGVLSAQMQNGRRKDRAWGVSECAYRAFDAKMNYQYRAFGVSDLSLSGTDDGDTVAPYASALSLSVGASESVQNLYALSKEGLKGSYGFYESADYSNGNIPEIVFCYMAHHQGMALTAIANYLSGNKISEYFMMDPREKSFLEILNEKPAPKRFLTMYFKRREEKIDRAYVRPRTDYMRHVKADKAHDGHMLFGYGTEAYIDSMGNGFLRKENVYMNLFRGDKDRYPERILPRVFEGDSEIKASGVYFDAGYALFEGGSSNIQYKTAVCISPQTGQMIFSVSIRSLAENMLRVRIRQAFSVSLMTKEEMNAHPVFGSLFMEAYRSGEDEWTYERRKRKNNGAGFMLKAGVYGFESYEPQTDDMRSTLKNPDDTNVPFRKDMVLDGSVCLAPGAEKEVFFTLQLLKDLEEGSKMCTAKREFERAKALSSAQARTLLSFAGIQAGEYRKIDSASKEMFSCSVGKAGSSIDRKPEALYEFGISEDMPVLLGEIPDSKALDGARKLIRAHEFLFGAGFSSSVVLIAGHESGYHQPLKTAIEGMILSSHLNGIQNQNGGIFIIDKERMTDEKQMLLSSIAVLRAVNGEIRAVRDAKGSGRPKRIPLSYANQYLSSADRISYNGFGGYTKDLKGYQIDVMPGADTPAPWCNMLANPDFGVLLTERGGGFMWYKNSRMGRITPFDNETAPGGSMMKIYLTDDNGYTPLLPGYHRKDMYRVTHYQGYTKVEGAFEEGDYEANLFSDSKKPIFAVSIDIRNKTGYEVQKNLIASMDFLMGTFVSDKRFLRMEKEDGMLFAKGRMDGIGFLTIKGGKDALEPIDAFPEDMEESLIEKGSYICRDVVMAGNCKSRITILSGWAENKEQAMSFANDFSVEESFSKTVDYFENLITAFTCDTAHPVRDALVNRFLKYQTLVSRVFGRCGMYQPGGAVGMRDQLQDMLSVLYMDRQIVKQHILNAASHQFEDGDGMHWWHPERSGVRTRISDDIVFIPFVTAKYIAETGDRGILDTVLPYLKNEEIPDGREDWYGEGRISEKTDTLYGHIMAAFRRAYRTGEHGLTLMGSGDWNDGMNRIGDRGKGESVWLSMFLSTTARTFAEYAADKDKEYLYQMADSLTNAVDQAAWDGKWYLRAYDDEGNKIGSDENAECRIDLISQAWAVINGQDEIRSKEAMESAENMLVQDETGIIRLLYPPFTGRETDPGYIAEYPEGVRENGGQYTHGACFFVMAEARRQNADEAWRLFDMLLPENRTNSREKTVKYRGEPYVSAADISFNARSKGACGWTWYTGAAAWTVRVMYEELLGLKIQGNNMRMNALLPSGTDEMKMEIKIGKSIYRFVSRRDAKNTLIDGNVSESGWAHVKDDGKKHVCVFPARNGIERKKKT
ncbi:MAG: DUF3131 domain-containing protein [Clostridia bacterium]|nr:DUF3131 domain-containing protein [Clostridia bacterium]MBQ4157682.1 DUF3131 domain-containing protein [Clostridia bacterium]